MAYDDDDSNIVDVENYRGGNEEEGFSKQKLVMTACRRCLEAGSREMRPGYYNQKTDRYGNSIKVYVEDTRKVFIESVETLEMFMHHDLNEEETYAKIAMELIKNIRKDLDEAYKKLCNEEYKDWENANIFIKKGRWKDGISYRKGNLNKNLQYYQEYIEEEVKAYRNIFKILINLTEVNNNYVETFITA